MKQFLRNMTGRDEFGLGREIVGTSRPRDVTVSKPMANPVEYFLVTCHLANGANTCTLSMSRLLPFQSYNLNISLIAGTPVKF